MVGFWLYSNWSPRDPKFSCVSCFKPNKRLRLAALRLRFTRVAVQEEGGWTRGGLRMGVFLVSCGQVTVNGDMRS